jgi:lysophospholipase L1-like esterase
METAAPSRRVARRARTLLAACGLFVVSAIPAFAAGVCPAAPAAPIVLPHLRSALLHGEQAIIVALGSSSTLGVMASDLAHSYPAVLQQTLSLELADSHIAVINRGIGGQDAREELARMANDVLAIRPQVVIWQVGANGALRNSDPELFRDRVTTGVRMLQATGVDVVLMDNQQSPRLLARPEEPVMDAELAQAAKDTGAALFSRRALVQAWDRAGATPAEFIATDGLHHNDRGYHCVATALARSIVAGLAADRPLTASR